MERSFQSALPRGERPSYTEYVGSKTGISIRAPAWGATYQSTCIKILNTLFQSALPRGERRNSVKEYRCRKYLNPRSRVGSVKIIPIVFCHRNHFNPRSRVGSDLRRSDMYATIDIISIRAPAWGATTLVDLTADTVTFQSALPRGERQCSRVVRLPLIHFNPRSRVGSDGTGYCIW